MKNLIVKDSKMEKINTVLRDLRESSFIYENDKLCMDGLEYSEAFEHDGIAIYNPYTDSTGRFEVDAIEEYGDKYINWYNSLGSSKYEDAIESINPSEHYLSQNWVKDEDGMGDYDLDDYSMFIKNDELWVWIDRGEYLVDRGDFEHLKMASLRYFKMMVYAEQMTGVDYPDMLLHPTEHTIELKGEDCRFCDAMDFDEFIDENTHDGEGV